MNRKGTMETIEKTMTISERRKLKMEEVKNAIKDKNKKSHEATYVNKMRRKRRRKKNKNGG